MITLTVRLRIPMEIDSAIEQLTNNIIEAAKLATLEISARNNHEIRELVKEKRKARMKWHWTRDSSDKTIWNHTRRLLHEKINGVKNEMFKFTWVIFMQLKTLIFHCRKLQNKWKGLEPTYHQFARKMDHGHSVNCIPAEWYRFCTRNGTVSTIEWNTRKD